MSQWKILASLNYDRVGVTVDTYPESLQISNLGAFFPLSTSADAVNALLLYLKVYMRGEWPYFRVFVSIVNVYFMW